MQEHERGARRDRRRRDGGAPERAQQADAAGADGGMRRDGGGGAGGDRAVQPALKPLARDFAKSVFESVVHVRPPFRHSAGLASSSVRSRPTA